MLTSRKTLWGICLSLCLVPIGWTCGFQGQATDALGASPEGLLGYPGFSFAGHLDEMASRLSMPKKGGGGDKHWERTAEKDCTDLEQSLRAKGVDGDAAEAILTQYKESRDALARFVASREGYGFRVKQPVSISDLEKLSIPQDIPEEFRLYLRGAIAYHRGSIEEASTFWNKLLSLPSDQRHYRTVWAAFMLARIHEDDSPMEALRRYSEIPILVEEGFQDSLELSLHALGRQARVKMKLGRHDEALKHYLTQYAAGVEGSYQSLTFAATIASASSGSLATIAKDPLVREMMTSFLLGWKWEDTSKLETWVVLLHTEGIEHVAFADQLAWMAYATGHFDLAEKWLGVSPTDSPYMIWLKGMFELREGLVDEALETLLQAQSCFEKTNLADSAHGASAGYVPSWFESARRLQSGISLLYMQRQQYEEALTFMMKSRKWHDAAYVAEKILTPDEVEAYLKKLDDVFNESETDRTVDESSRNEQRRLVESLRYLVARRLARLGRWKHATEYYPEKFKPKFGTYIESIRNGNNKSLPPDERAEFLWTAAQIARYDGMELLGTELEPDWKSLSGSFELVRWNNPYTEEENRRYLAHQVTPFQRYHYRYTAADHAWAAAKLMPDESDQTALVLCKAGTWLKNRDPLAADRFYKALVKRCGTTELGKEAKERKWFPNVE